MPTASETADYDVTHRFEWGVSRARIASQSDFDGNGWWGWAPYDENGDLCAAVGRHATAAQAEKAYRAVA